MNPAKDKTQTKCYSWNVKLLSTCALILVLSPGATYGMIQDDEDEKYIYLPCIPPQESSPQGSQMLSDDYFEGELSPEQKSQESVLMKGDKGNDGRKFVSKTTVFPYSAQVYFVVQFPDLTREALAKKNKSKARSDIKEIGSGSFIHKSAILTAAHVVYSHQYGGFFKAVECLPAANNKTVPFGQPYVNGVKIDPEYLKSGSKEHDYALVFINQPLGTKTGIFGLMHHSDHRLDELNVTISGYPGDKIQNINQPKMFEMEGAIKRVSPNELMYEIDTAPGQSGSGIWYKGPKDGYFLVGVHAYGVDPSFRYNHGPRLTKERLEKITGWLKEFDSGKIKYDNITYIARKEKESANKLGIQIILYPDEEGLPYAMLTKAKEGDAQAQFEIGQKYFSAQGVERDKNKALFWIKKAAEQGYAEAQYDLANRYNNGKDVPKDDKEALKWYRLAAQELDEAQYHLGIKYINGSGVPKDNKEGLRLIRLAADQGFARAQRQLGVIYNNGTGVPKDDKEAFKWFRLAAEKGFAEGQRDLGTLYKSGTGVSKDVKEAVKWLSLAAEQGLDKAQYDLGMIYYNGTGVPRDLKEAIRLLRLAANQGLARAQCDLGIIYYLIDTREDSPYGPFAQENSGVNFLNQSMIYTRMAAEQGFAEAQYQLGSTARDLLRFIQRQRIAELERKDRAKTKLGERRAFALRTISDEAEEQEAVKWFSLAAAQGHKRAKEKLELLSKK